MSWSRRSILLTLAALPACGFSPALAPSGSASGFQGNFEFNAPNNSEGYYLTRQLEKRLGRPSAPEYRIDMDLTLGDDLTGIPADRVTARANLLGRVDYTIVHIPTGDTIQRGRVRSFTGYSSTSTTAATRSARTDAERRLMTLLGDRIVADLMATAETWRR